MTDRIRALADAASSVEFADLPDAVVARAAMLIVDTLAAVVAGLRDPAYRAFALSNCVDAGRCSVPGVATGTSLLAAVSVNSGATTVMQIQDGHRTARGHPASQIVPLLLAMAEHHGGDWKDMIAALAAGYEVGTRIGNALGGMQDALHDAGNWSAVGATVAALHFRGVRDPGKLAEGIEASAATVLFPWSRTTVGGATSHHLYMGLGGVVALQSARAVLAGLTALGGATEDFLLLRAGAHPDPTKLVSGVRDGRFDRYEILSGYLKVHPVCAHWSSTADAIAALVKDHGALHDQAEAVEVAIYGYALHYDVADPINELAARFSGRAIVAAMLQDGQLHPGSLSDARRSSSDFRDRMDRIRIVHDPALDAGYPIGRPVRVTVRLSDGRVLVKSWSVPRGDAAAPLTEAEVRAKAATLIGPAFGSSARPLFDALDAYAGGGSIAPLSVALRETYRAA